MFVHKSSYSVLSKAIVWVLVCLFCANTLSFADSDTLAPLVGNPRVYQEMHGMMEERLAEHQEPIDEFIKQHANKAKSLSAIPNLQEEFTHCVDVCGANNMFARLKTTLVSAGGSMQVIFVRGEDELPVFDRKKAWGHAGTYVTVFALESEKDTKEGRRKIVGRLLHEIRARSTRAKELFDEEFDKQKPATPEGIAAFIKSAREKFEKDNLRIQQEIEQSDRITSPTLAKEFTSLTFAAHPEVMNRDYMIGQNPEWTRLREIYGNLVEAIDEDRFLKGLLGMERMLRRTFTRTLLHTLKRNFSPDELRKCWDGIVTLVNTPGTSPLELFQNGIPSIRRKLFYPQGIDTQAPTADFCQLWPDIVFLGQIFRRNTNEYFTSIAPSCLQNILNVLRDPRFSREKAYFYEIIKSEIPEFPTPENMGTILRDLQNKLAGLRARSANPSQVLPRYLELTHLREEGLDTLPNLVLSSLSMDVLKIEMEKMKTREFQIDNPVHLDLFYLLVRNEMKGSSVYRRFSDYEAFSAFIRESKLVPADLLRWSRHADHLNSLLNIIQPSYQDRLRRAGFEPKGFISFVYEIIRHGSPADAHSLKDLLDLPEVSFDTHANFRSVIVHKNIEWRIKIAIINLYIEFISITEFLVKRSKTEKEILAEITAYGAYEAETYSKALAAINALLSEIKTADSRSRRRRIQEAIGEEIKSLRQCFLKALGGEDVKTGQLLMNDPQISRKILTVIKILAMKPSFERRIIIECMKVLFSSFDARLPDAIGRANTILRNHILNLDQKIAGHKSNAQVIDELVARGYSKQLWTEGIDNVTLVAEGITKQKKSKWIKQASYEALEIVLDSGLKFFKNQPLTLERADEFDSYEKTKALCGELESKVKEIPEHRTLRLRAILEYIQDVESKPVAEVEPHNFRVTIKKDFLQEATAGIGVPGCYAPDAINAAMPLIRAVEANSFFIQIYNEEGQQIANAEIVLTKEGAYVYAGYNGSIYDVDQAFADALLELVDYVPCLILNRNSAGYRYLQAHGKHIDKTIELVKPSTVFSQQYFDMGSRDEEGNLTLTIENPLIVNKNTRRARILPRKVEAVASAPVVATPSLKEKSETINWQLLADKLLKIKETDQGDYLFLIKPLKDKVAQQGHLVIDDDFYRWIHIKISEKLGPEIDSVKSDEIADTLIDFLEQQNWPMEIMTPLENGTSASFAPGTETSKKEKVLAKLRALEAQGVTEVDVINDMDKRPGAPTMKMLIEEAIGYAESYQLFLEDDGKFHLFGGGILNAPAGEQAAENTSEVNRVLERNRQRMSAAIENIKGLIAQKDSVLGGFLKMIPLNLQVPGRLIISPTARMNAADIVLDITKEADRMSAGVLTIDDDKNLKLMINQLMDTLGIVVKKVRVPQEKEPLLALIKECKDLVLELKVFLRISAFARHSKGLKSEDVEPELMKFIRDPKEDPIERAMAASGFLFVRNSASGFISLISDASVPTLDRQTLDSLYGITMNCFDNYGVWAEEKDRALASRDLYQRLADAKSTDERNKLIAMLNTFIVKGLLDLSETNDSLKGQVADIILSIIRGEKDPQVIDTLLFILAGFAPLKAREVISANRWPKLGPEGLPEQLKDPVHQQLCVLLKKHVVADIQDSAYSQLFQEYYPTEQFPVLADRFARAINRVNDAMTKIPRHLFLPVFMHHWASMDSPLVIPMGHGQTISQPSLVQRMTALLNPQENDKVLEVGTGSGYQAAVLSKLAREVHTVEVYEDLSQRAKENCDNLGIDNIKFHIGDGSAGLSKEGPFDIIIVTAGAPALPEALLDQLNEKGGRMLIPVSTGKFAQGGEVIYDLVLIVRDGIRYKKISIGPTGWVPLVGKRGYQDRIDREAYLGEPRPLTGQFPPEVKLDAPAGQPEAAAAGVSTNRMALENPKPIDVTILKDNYWGIQLSLLGLEDVVRKAAEAMKDGKPLPYGISNLQKAEKDGYIEIDWKTGRIKLLPIPVGCFPEKLLHCGEDRVPENAVLGNPDSTAPTYIKTPGSIVMILPQQSTAGLKTYYLNTEVLVSSRCIYIDPEALRGVIGRGFVENGFEYGHSFIVLGGIPREAIVGKTDKIEESATIYLDFLEVRNAFDSAKLNNASAAELEPLSQKLAIQTTRLKQSLAISPEPITPPALVGSKNQQLASAAKGIELERPMEEELAAFEKEWRAAELNVDQFLQALSPILELQTVLDHDKPVFVFSEKVAFNNNLAKCLPKLEEKGIKVAVIVKTDKERALIDKLNEGKSNDKKILMADTIEGIREAAAKAQVQAPRFYYFRMKDSTDPIFEGRNITMYELTPDMVKRIIDAIGSACRVAPEKLPLLHEMARKFAEAA